MNFQELIKNFKHATTDRYGFLNPLGVLIVSTTLITTGLFGAWVLSWVTAWLPWPE